MVGKAIIGTIILIAISLMIFTAIAPDAISGLSNATDTLTDQGVSSSTVAVFGLVGIIAVVAVVMLYLKVGTGGR